MSRHVSRGSPGEYQADERAGFTRLSSRVSGIIAGRCRVAPVASIRQMSRQMSPGSGGDIRQMRGQVSRGSVGEYQADDRAGSRGSVGEYQADERERVARLSWLVSGR